MTGVLNVSTEPVLNPHMARAVFDIAGKNHAVTVTANVELTRGCTPWIPPATVTAMGKGLEIHFAEPVDRIAVEGAKRAQELLYSWYPDALTLVDVAAGTHDEISGNDSRGVGCFFSGGVDSFYSATCHSEKITHLILVHGLDISLGNIERWSETLERMRTVAAGMGKTLIEVRSDLRILHAKYGPHWQQQAHGAFLANIALLLSGHLHTVIISSSDDWSTLVPIGTHPDLDPHWSSSGVTIRHDDLANRTAKLDVLRHNGLAMDHLRVCWANLAKGYNCSRCEKCIRTMISLRMVGALERCQTFPDEIPLKRLRQLYLRASGPGGVQFAEENLRLLREREIDDQDLIDALEYVLNRRGFAEMWAKTRYYVVEVGYYLARYYIRKALRRNV